MDHLHRRVPRSRARFVWRIVAGLLAAALCGPLAVPVASASTALMPGDAAPDFELQDQFGDVHRLSDYRGEVVLLHFCTLWCAPCRDFTGGLPTQFAELDAAIGPDRYEVIEVLLEDQAGRPSDAAAAALWATEVLGLPDRPVLHLGGDGGLLADVGGYPITFFPSLLLISENGVYLHEVGLGEDLPDAILGAVGVTPPPEFHPVAVADNYEVDVFDGPFAVDAADGLLANDFDENGDALTARPGSSVISTPEGIGLGSVHLGSDGALTVEPSQELVENFDLLPILVPGFVPTGTFDYQVVDATGRRSSGLVSVSFTKANTAPSITSFEVPAYPATGERVTATLEVEDADGDSLTVSLMRNGISVGSAQTSGGLVSIDLEFTTPGFETLTAEVSDGREVDRAFAETLVLDGSVFRTLAGRLELSDGSGLILGTRQNGGDIVGTLQLVTPDRQRYRAQSVAVSDFEAEGTRFLELRGATGEGFDLVAVLGLGSDDAVTSVVAFDVVGGSGGARFFVEATVERGSIALT